MSMRLKVDGTGKIAIYDTSSPSGEDAPFTDPMANLSYLRFHSSLHMPRIISTTTYSLTLSAYSIDTINRTTYTVAAHGRGGIPLVFGVIPSLSLTMMGTVWILDAGGARRLTLGADATNILLREECRAASAMSTRSVDIDVHVCDYLLDGASPPGDGTDAEYIKMEPTLIKAQRGAWRSDNRYLRNATTGATMNVPREATITLSKTVDSRGGYSPSNASVSGNPVSVKTQ